MGMRRTALLLASISATLLLASGVALAASFPGHWESVTGEESLYYYNPEKVYPAVVEEEARGWTALDGRFNGRGVRLIEVGSQAEATVLIDGYRDCDNKDLLGVSRNRERGPNLLGINTCALDGRSRKMREHVITHEFGHHLGSGHQPRKFCETSVMLELVPCGRERTVLTKPGTTDVSWYKNRWVS
jgi:hypothetical protein